MIWTDRQGLNVLQNSSDTAGDIQDYGQIIKSRLAIGKFIASLFRAEGIYFGGAQSISDFTNNGKNFPHTSLIINGDISSSVGGVLTVDINNGGSLYSVDDIVTIVGGHHNAVLKVLQVSTGVVSSVQIVSCGTSYAVANGYETTVSPISGSGCVIDVLSITGEPWFFSSIGEKLINFYVTNAPGNTGVLYAQIKPISGLFPVAAAGHPDDFILVAKSSSSTPAPNNSIKLGTGTINNSAFVSWAPEDNIFVDITPYTSKTWIADTHSGSVTIYDKDIFYINGENGIHTSVSENNNYISISSNLQSDGGLVSINNQLGIKIKSDGGFGVNSSGLFVSNISLNFNIQANSGSNFSVYDKNTLIISGASPLTIVASATDTLTISLLLLSTGGLETTVDNKLSLKLDPSGKLLKDTNGLYSKNVSFNITGNSAQDNILQIINEQEILNFYGTNSIYTDNTTVNSGRIQIGLNLYTNGGLTNDRDELSILIDLSPPSGSEVIILDADGLSLTSAILHSYYGHPSSGSYSTDDLYRDKSGALFICDIGGTPGTWSQLSIGITYETSDDQNSQNYILPLNSDFNGSLRQVGYRINWISGFDYLNEYFKTMTWIWHSESIARKYWISQSEFPIQMGKLYFGGSVCNSNPVTVSVSGFTAPVVTITPHTVNIASFKAFWSYLKNSFDALLLEHIYSISNIDTIVSYNYTYSPYNEYDEYDEYPPYDDSYSIGAANISSGIGIFNYNKGLKYDETNLRLILLATFNSWIDEYSHIDQTMYCRYIKDQDGMMITTP